MQTVLLIVALSMDVFLASVACGAEQIRIEKKTALCIGAVCSGVLFFSLVCGKLIDGVVRHFCGSSPSCARQGNSFYKRFSESSDGIHRNVTLRRYDVKNREVSAL